MVQYPAYYYNQSAVIPVRGRGDELRVFMITSRNKKRWIIPKGIVESDLTPAESAAREAHEEAGIDGTLFAEPIGVYEYEKWGGTCVAQVFVMEVTTVHDQWLENFRERIWVTLDEAIRRVNEIELQNILRQLPAFLATSGH